MDVLVIKIDWYVDIPIAKVYNVSGDIFYTSLLHRSFVQRHKIGVGTHLRLQQNNLVERVIKSSGNIQLPETDSVFDRWFLFRAQLKPYVSGYTRKLFIGGIESVRELRERRSSVGKIRGIGPVTTMKIHNMLDSEFSIRWRDQAVYQDRAVYERGSGWSCRTFLW